MNMFEKVFIAAYLFLIGVSNNAPNLIKKTYIPFITKFTEKFVKVRKF